MIFTPAFAQETETPPVPADMDAVGSAAAASPADAFLWNMGLILVLVVMFYLLLIRPQQKRFAAHREMLDGLKKGDKVVTAGGLVGTIDRVKEGEDEVIINLGEVKVTAMRNTLSSKAEAAADAKTNVKVK